MDLTFDVEPFDVLFWTKRFGKKTDCVKVRVLHVVGFCAVELAADSARVTSVL